MLSRRLTTKIAFVLDECLPPILRDASWFMWLPFRLMFGDQAKTFADFKARAFGLDAQQYKDVYRTTAAVHIERETDLNPACVERILDNVAGQTILEVGCGRLYLARRLAGRGEVTACDMVLPAPAPEDEQLTLLEAAVGALPFDDNAFDTVVCTHTLEHIPDLVGAIAQLRRVARKRLIIVVPRQRPYRHTFDLHLHFFPYRWSLEAFLANPPRAHQLELLGGDWYYQEESAGEVQDSAKVQ